jgi:hypothetical protein
MYRAKDYTSADIVEVRGHATFHRDGQMCEAHYEERVASGVMVWRAALPAAGVIDGAMDGVLDGAVDGLIDGAMDGLLATVDGRIVADGLRRPKDRAVRWTRSDAICEHGPGAVTVDVVVAVAYPGSVSDI